MHESGHLRDTSVQSVAYLGNKRSDNEQQPPLLSRRKVALVPRLSAEFITNFPN